GGGGGKIKHNNCCQIITAMKGNYCLRQLQVAMSEESDDPMFAGKAQSLAKCLKKITTISVLCGCALPGSYLFGRMGVCIC
ncbi:MAG: hypothetical protein KGZ45_02965, partial [Clostridium sp.]|nr:hypothetical protein [Clostridium sp.]